MPADGLHAERVGERWLLTNRLGHYAFLSDEEYESVMQCRESEQLMERLEAEMVHITQGNIERASEIQTRKACTLFQGTSLHIVIPTLRCNHVCAYCHAASVPQDADGYDMDEATLARTITLIFQSPSSHIGIEFQGGEPLLRFDLVKRTIELAEAANRLHHKELRFALVTNLTAMTEEMLDYLIEHKVGVCTSIDGPKEIHDALRKHCSGSSYDAVVLWVKRIVARNPDMLNALTVVTKRSLGHPERIMDELASLGLTRIWFKHANYLGYAVDSWKKLGFTAEQYIEFYSRSIDHIIERKLPVRDVFTTMVLRKILLKEEPGYLDLQSPCGAAIGQMAYNYDGSVYSCDEGRMVPGDVFRLGDVSMSHREILTSSQTKAMIAASVNDAQHCDTCCYKAYCGLCPVCNYVARGTLVPNLPLDLRCQILKGIFKYLFTRIAEQGEHLEAFKAWVEAPKRERI